MAKTAELKVRIQELEGELRRSKAREKELKAELIEARDLLDRQADTVESVHDLHQGCKTYGVSASAWQRRRPKLTLRTTTGDGGQIMR